MAGILLSGAAVDSATTVILTTKLNLTPTDAVLLGEKLGQFPEVATFLAEVTGAVAAQRVVYENKAGVGSPKGVIVPDFVPQYYRNTANDSRWVSTAFTSADWQFVGTPALIKV